MASFALSDSSAKTTSGTSTPVTDQGDERTMRVQLDVTAVTGVAPTLDVVIEDSLDGSTWNVIGTFGQKTAVSREVINITVPFTNTVRARWTLGGTSPSFTFSVLAYSE